MATEDRAAKVEELLQSVVHKIGDGDPGDVALLPFSVSELLSPGIGTQSGEASDFVEAGFHQYYDSTDADDMKREMERIATIADEEYDDIVYKGDLLYRTPLSFAYLLTNQQWDSVFGESPEYLDSWDAIWKFFSDQIIAKSDRSLNGEGLIAPTTASKVQDRMEHTSKVPLVLTGSPSDELCSLGLLTEQQSQAYSLREFGYKNREVANLMGVDTGTASSHINRAERKMEVVRQGSMIDSRFERYNSRDVPHPERVGLSYTTPSGQEATVLGVGMDDAYETVYVVEYENGNVEIETSMTVDSWAQYNSE